MIRARPLSRAAYRAYGDVIEASGPRPRRANLGLALRYDWLAELRSSRAEARPNACVFRCRPWPRKDFSVRLLERHAYSTQAFVPMAGVRRYLLVVCLGGSRPDLATLKAFVATGSQGVTYHPGVWHHPLVALDRAADFACLVWETKGRGDCDEFPLASPIPLSLPFSR